MWKCDGSLHLKRIRIAIKEYGTDNLLNQHSASTNIPPNHSPYVYRLHYAFQRARLCPLRMARDRARTRIQQEGTEIMDFCRKTFSSNSKFKL